MPDGAASASPDDVERGRAALLEITSASTIGDPIGSADEGDGVVSVYFGVEMPGYPGWRWTATIAHLDDAEPTVLETEMTPGDGSLLAPDWVPWVDRLADYHAAQDAAELAARDADDGDDPSDDDADDDDDDLSDEGEEESEDADDDGEMGMRSLLHAGDLDGVDIDALDEEADDEDNAEVGTDDEAGADAAQATAASASPADDVEQSEAAEHDPERAGDEPVGSEPGDQRTDQQ